MKTENNAANQAAAQLSSIRAMLAALNCDYDKLEELQGLVDDERDNLSEFRKEEAVSLALTDDEAEEFRALKEAAGDCSSKDQAQQRIHEDALSIQVRSGWHSVGEELEAAEFEILLCTGGPAVRIMGELDEHNQPTRAYMQYQDWGTPWTDYFEEGVGESCLEYAQQFYFGE